MSEAIGETYNKIPSDCKSDAESADYQRMSDASMSPEEEKERTDRLRFRMRAARAIAGLTVKELAARVADAGHADGLSARVLGEMERGNRVIKPSEIPILAEACGLPAAFFSVDFATLEEPTLRAEVDYLRSEIAKIKGTVAELATDLARDSLALREHREKDHPGESSGDEAR
jgi:transcriptional regulator with XRE-family HTH domain